MIELAGRDAIDAAAVGFELPGEILEGLHALAVGRYGQQTRPGLAEPRDHLPDALWIVLGVVAGVIAGVFGSRMLGAKTVASARAEAVRSKYTPLTSVLRDRVVRGLVAFNYAQAVAFGAAFALVEHTGSVVDGIWWAIVTLTSVGYGDVTPAMSSWKRALWQPMSLQRTPWQCSPTSLKTIVTATCHSMMVDCCESWPSR